MSFWKRILGKRDPMVVSPPASPVTWKHRSLTEAGFCPSWDKNYLPDDFSMAQEKDIAHRKRVKSGEEACICHPQEYMDAIQRRKRRTWWHSLKSLFRAAPPAAEVAVPVRSNPPVKCPRCRERTTGKLFQVGSVRLCEGCAKSPLLVSAAKRAGWKIRMVRA
jgi:hypothetical protein